ncbi:MAG TPA: tetratricopeptide repeat protein, partial [Blastocatellia bacterium]|nr:tetratricopeptide repeat protein [Blastocatellia bacterium]
MAEIKKLALIGVALLVGCSFVGGAAQEPTLTRANQLLSHGDYKAAITMFQSLLQQEATEREAQIGLLSAEIETGAYRDAETRARQYVAASPGDGRLHNLLAEVLLDTGRLADAQKEFESATESAKGEAWLKATLGKARALIAQGKTDEAQTSLRQFIAYYNSNQPRTAPELTLIARGLHLLEKYKDANELFTDARAADKDFVDAYIGQGELLDEKYSYGDATASFADALKINPNSPEAHFGMASCKRQESDGETESELTKALSVNPN